MNKSVYPRSGIRAGGTLRYFPTGIILLAVINLAAWTAHATVYTVTSVADSGPGSLRQAILNANTNSVLTNPGVQNIRFQISGPTETIALASALPVVSVPAVIDATTQPGYTNQPIVELNGAAAAAANGLELAAPGTVRGLVINRFAKSAIQLDGPSNTIAGNWIGTDTNGLLILANANYGIFVKSSFNVIGGTNAADRNVIDGNNTGIYISTPGASNSILGNWIGVNASNSLALGNANNGITIYNSAGNLVGGPNAGAANVISGNHASGIYLYEPGTTGNVVQGNFIGTDVSGGVLVSNANDGITVNAAAGNLIGPGNLISGNGGAGVNLANATASSNTVAGNYIGTDKTGRLAVRNLVAGIAISAGGANQIGGTNAGAGNLISGNFYSGIQLTTGAHGNWIQGNLIGVDATGTNALANGQNGIAISGGTSNFIGGALSGARNIISGNASNGVYLQFYSDTNNQVQGNYIGTDITGTQAVGNVQAGILIQGNSNLIGGALPGTGNLISGNGQQGVLVGNAGGEVIQGNIIGMNVTGAQALPNGAAGVGLSFAPHNQIGGPSAGARNLISANNDAGIFLLGAASTGNVIQGNYIGTDSTGRQPFGNYNEGIYSQDAVSNQIGGTVTGAGNLISANGTRGIWLTNSSWTTIQGNYLGTDVTGSNNLGNATHTIELAAGASTNLVGGTAPGAANRIAFAQTIYAGVRVRDGAQADTISGNAIFGNGGYGIDLGAYGPNFNSDCESGVAASAANHWQNYPVLTNVVYAANSTLVGGYFDSGAGKTYQLQFFANPAIAPDGYGQGQVYLGAVTVTLGGFCTSNFTAVLPVAVPPGWVLAATATDAAGNTSEFSIDAPTQNPPDLQMSLTYPSSHLAVNKKGRVYTATTYHGIMLTYTNKNGVFTLQKTFSLLPPVTWVNVTNPVTYNSGVYSVVASNPPPIVFYRLATP